MQQVAVVTGGRAASASRFAPGVCRPTAWPWCSATSRRRRSRRPSARSRTTAQTVLGVAADVRDPVGMTGLRDAAFARFGRADLVSLNAGVALRRDVADMSEADWDWILDINLRGVIRGVTAFLPALEEQGSGPHPGDRVVPRPRRRPGVRRLLRVEVGHRGADGDALPRAAAEGLAGRGLGALSRARRSPT